MTCRCRLQFVGDVMGAHVRRFGEWWTPVQGTPRWAVVAAWGAVWCVVPSSLWRTAVGFGVPLGWTEEWLRMQHIPGTGTLYVLTLSVLSIGLASLTLGLVYPWGERVPARVPLLGGRRLPVALVAGTAIAGAVPLTAIVVLSAANWSLVSGFAGRLTSGWALLATACYLPAALWPALVVAATVAYVRRRRTGSPPAS